MTEGYKNFIYGDEKEREEFFRKIKDSEVNLDKIRGGLFGGAVGDALGYPVEFWTLDKIVETYGADGIRSYALDEQTGKALISDDTQMSLFTACGIVYGDTRQRLREHQANLAYYVWHAYLEWLSTQNEERHDDEEDDGPRISWLLDVPELWSRRAPGNTCLSALDSGNRGSVGNPVNNSKGCGGIMRVAPLALFCNTDDRPKLDMEGAEIAALTHGHSLGYIPAAMLTHIVNVGVYGGCTYGTALEDAVREAMQVVLELFAMDNDLSELLELVDKAILLSKNDAEDVDNIRSLGEGWVAEETLAIAIYCSLRYPNDFSKGVIAAVNHSGDSDSTGAVTGNILGAWLGYDAIEDKWKRNLELKDIILEMADDLCHGCLMEEYYTITDFVWVQKYVRGRYVNSRLNKGDGDETEIITEDNRYGRYIPGKTDDVIDIASSGLSTIYLSKDKTIHLGRHLDAYVRYNTGEWIDFIAIAGGFQHIVGLKKDGTVVATGENDYGQCNVADWKDIAAISVGQSYTAGLRKDGTVVATGRNDEGVCNVADWRDIVLIHAGRNHIAALRKDGTVVATGENDYGQCDVADWRDIVDISPGTKHTVGVRKDGTVIAVGANNFGQCDVAEWRGIKAIFTRYITTVGLREDGTVIATGHNKYGQCNVTDWRDVIDISVEGCFRTVGLRKDGTVIAAGHNAGGQCNVESWRNIIAIACSLRETVGLRSDGTILIAT